MTSHKRDRMAAATCTQAVLRAFSTADLNVMASTVLTPRKRDYWAVTTVKPLDRGVDGSKLAATLALSSAVPARDVKIVGSWFSSTVQVRWKTGR